MVFENAGHCAITNLQNPFLSKSRSDLSGTEMWVLEFILDYFALIFSCKPFGMRANSMGLVFQVLDASATFPESLEIIVDGTDWEVFFFADLLGTFLALQDRTDQLVSLNCIHGVASRICLWLQRLFAILTRSTLVWRRL